MKCVLILALIYLNTAVSFSQTAVFFSPKDLHKFPKTIEGDTLKHRFEIQNNGTDTLRISEYKVACTCTKVIFPKVVAPGETAFVDVSFDTNKKYYQQDRKILLFTNTKKKIETLRFKVYVIPLDEVKK